MAKRRSRIRGDFGFRKLIRRLPDAARDEMGDILEAAGIELLAEMQRDVAKRTGALERGLGYKLLRKSLRLRVGLVGSKRANADLFYGIIVEKGRKAQTVTTRRGYKLRVRAMAPRPFVWKKRIEDRARIAARLRSFWDLTLADAAEGIGGDD